MRAFIQGDIFQNIDRRRYRYVPVHLQGGIIVEIIGMQHKAPARFNRAAKMNLDV